MNKHIVPKDIKLLSKVMDTQFTGPFNLKFGLDSILGVIPVGGDLLSLVLSHYILVRSIFLKCPKSILLKMAFNSYLDFLIGSIPFIGDIFDLYWKSNTKNALLLENYLSSPKKRRKTELIFLISMSISLFIILILIIYLSLKIVNLLLMELS